MPSRSVCKLYGCCSCLQSPTSRGISFKCPTFAVPQRLQLTLWQAFVKLQAELTREGMIVEMGGEDPDGKSRSHAVPCRPHARAQLHRRVLVLITASMRQLMEEAELLQLAVRVKQVRRNTADSRYCGACFYYRGSDCAHHRHHMLIILWPRMFTTTLITSSAAC